VKAAEGRPVVGAFLVAEQAVAKLIGPSGPILMWPLGPNAGFRYLTPAYQQKRTAYR